MKRNFNLEEYSLSQCTLGKVSRPVWSGVLPVNFTWKSRVYWLFLLRPINSLLIVFPSSLPPIQVFLELSKEQELGNVDEEVNTTMRWKLLCHSEGPWSLQLDHSLLMLFKLMSYVTISSIYNFKTTSQLVLVVKNSPANARDTRDADSIPGSGRSPGGGHGSPLQCSCLENPTDRGACWIAQGTSTQGSVVT